MRKVINYIMLLLLLSVMLTGCSERKNDENTTARNLTSSAAGKTDAAAKAEKKDNKPVKITIWHDKEDAVAKVLQTELDKLAPEIQVTLVKKEGLTDSLKLVGNDPKSAPDMYFFAHDKIGVFAEMGVLAPITDFISKDVFQNYMKTTVQTVTYKNQIYQLPLYYETLLYMYNKAYMTADQVPKTTEELYAYMKKHTNNDRYGFVEQYSTPYYSVPWIHGFGGYLINSDGKIGLTMPDTIKALTYHKKFIKYMPGESDYNTVNILFMNGKADSIIGGPWLVPNCKQKGIDLGFAKMPTVDETGLPLAPYMGTQGIQVLKVAEKTKKEAITKILKQLTSPEIGIALAKASGCAPANKACYDDASVKNDEMVMMMKETAEKAVPMPNIPAMDVMWNVTGNMLTNINMKNADPSKEAQKTEKQAKELIAEMK